MTAAGAESGSCAGGISDDFTRWACWMGGIGYAGSGIAMARFPGLLLE